MQCSGHNMLHGMKRVEEPMDLALTCCNDSTELLVVQRPGIPCVVRVPGGGVQKNTAKVLRSQAQNSPVDDSQKRNVSSRLHGREVETQ